MANKNDFTLEEWTVVLEAPGKGRGVFAARDILAGTTISLAYVIPFPNGALNGTPLSDHPFDYEENDQECIVLGVQQLVNHSDKPNCGREWLRSDQTIHRLFAVRHISQGEE